MKHPGFVDLPGKGCKTTMIAIFGSNRFIFTNNGGSNGFCGSVSG
jgi:hypothetical protein